MSEVTTGKTQKELEALYDADGDGIGPLERIMMRYDKNGDGVFSKTEVKSIVREQNDAEKAFVLAQRARGLGIGAYMLALVAIFLCCFLSNEVAKDDHPVQAEGGSVSIDNKGNGEQPPDARWLTAAGGAHVVVGVGAAKMSHSILDAVHMSTSELLGMQCFSFDLTSGGSVGCQWRG